jgi:hypothetical protein
MHVSTWMHLKIKANMFEQFSKPLKVNGIHISLYNFFDLCAKMAIDKPNKMITHCFSFKNLSLDEEIQHCCHCFQL